jgi:hypothetical protein
MKIVSVPVANSEKPNPAIGSQRYEGCGADFQCVSTKQEVALSIAYSAAAWSVSFKERLKWSNRCISTLDDAQETAELILVIVWFIEKNQHRKVGTERRLQSLFNNADNVFPAARGLKLGGESMNLGCQFLVTAGHFDQITQLALQRVIFLSEYGDLPFDKGYSCATGTMRQSEVCQ